VLTELFEPTGRTAPAPTWSNDRAMSDPSASRSLVA
jgi:hypothetical protein